ncbi:MAG: beta-ketoacyl synthase N-terminal-like domain-containing protein [Acidobacteriota bacterium]
MSSLPTPVGPLALAIAVPDRIVTNDHWRSRQPQLVAQAEEKIWMWKSRDLPKGSEAFAVEMQPFLEDPFRGAVQRRFMEEGVRSIDLEVEAVERALAAADLDISDIDLLICTSFLPDTGHGIGGAAFLARALGLDGAAWNIESACSSSLLGFQNACSLIATGQYRRALVVTSCNYSHVVDEAEAISWTVGDGATAMVVGPQDDGFGFLGGHSIHSGNTCGAVAYHLDLDPTGAPVYRMRAGKEASRLLRETSESHLALCTEEALARSGLGLDDIDFFVFNTPLAWYAAFCAHFLGVPHSKTINMHPIYNNVGPALLGVNLFHAAHWRLTPGDRVLFYTVGSVSSCAAAVVRWSDVALGPIPQGASLEDYHAAVAQLPQAPQTFAAVA